MHQTPLIATLVAGFVLAFVLGAVAQRLRLSPLVGYLLAGVAIGPATPGYVADVELAQELAELGVILLMFGVGLHFSLRDLLSVRAIAIPGALGQIAIATLLGMALAWALGWSVVGGLVFGLALSVASTVVLLRALQDRHLLDTDRGRIAVGWLIVEDLAMVMTLVLLPALVDVIGAEGAGGLRAVLAPLAAMLAKVTIFVALMLVVGRQVLPWVLHRVAGTGSRELFTLSVLALALGIAFGSAELFGVSFALGAFFAGMVLAESELSHRAAEDSLPLRDAFAVLFFVSVGMLFDPAIIVEMPLALLATYLIIVLGKSAAAYAIVRLFGYSRRTALTVSASLAQIGEFSFILATLGLSLGVLEPEAQDLILAGAILSIVTNPLLFSALGRILPRVAEVPAAPAAAPADAAEASPEPQPAAPTPAPDADDIVLVQSQQTGHTIVAGYGFVGRCLAEDLKALGQPFLVVDDRQDSTEQLRQEGIEAITGNAADAAVLKAANVAEAEWLLVALPNVFEAGQVLAKARKSNPAIRTCARAETEKEVEHLRAHGADDVVIGRREIANGMIDHAFGPVRPIAHPDGAPEGEAEPAMADDVEPA